jgi:hypothetical protein
MHIREGYSMQADVILGVTIAGLVPGYGAALVILCCLRMYAALPARNYDLIFVTYSHALQNNWRATTCALTCNSHFVSTQPLYIDEYKFVGLAEFLGSIMDILVGSVLSVFLQAFGCALPWLTAHPASKRTC